MRETIVGVYLHSSWFQVLLVIYPTGTCLQFDLLQKLKSDKSFSSKNVGEICIQIDSHKEIDNIKMTVNISNVQKPIDSN